MTNSVSPKRSVLVGISPPSKNLWEKGHIFANVVSVEGQPICWSATNYSLTEDDERQNALTLILQAYFDDSEEEVTSAAIVRAVQREFQTHFPKEDFFVEEWSTAPAPIPLRPIEGYDKVLGNCNFDNDTKQNEAQAILHEYGILCQRKILGSEEISELRQLADRAIKEVESAITKNRPDIRIGQDSFVFTEIASRNLERFDLRINAMSSSPISLAAIEFVDKHIRSQKKVESLLKEVLGGNDDESIHEIDCDISVIYSRSGAVTQMWHSDGKHQEDKKDGGWNDDGWRTDLAKPYALCLFIPLIDLNDTVGFTQFWPASHRNRDLVGFGQIANLTNATFDGVGKAGDAIWYDYRLMHRGMCNVSKDTLRPVIQVVFKQKWYVERSNYGTDSIYGNNNGTGNKT
mmetsp:Transcript_22158/g.33497  ORF Transcript_22158/g.33497 Transcript_22158/m.33497 type:complete len:404 (+) Transcript_22158:64-1275(+)